MNRLYEDLWRNEIGPDWQEALKSSKIPGTNIHVGPPGVSGGGQTPEGYLNKVHSRPSGTTGAGGQMPNLQDVKKKEADK